MNENEKRYLREKFKDDVEPYCLEEFTKKLDTTEEGAFDTLRNLSLKSCVAAILLSIFLGGFSVGRFYLGDVSGGVRKLLICIALAAISVIIFICVTDLVGLMFGYLFELPIIIWWLVDVITVKRKTRQANEEVLMYTVNRLQKAVT